MAPSLRDDIAFVRVSISDPCFPKAQVNGGPLWVCEEAPVIRVREGHEVRLSQDALVDLLRYLLAFFRSHPKLRGPGRKGVAEDE